MKKKVYIDQDGVLADFFGPYNKIRSGEIPYPHSKIGFFVNLEPIPGAIEAYKELEKYFDVYILTRPSIYNIHCYSEKAQWVKDKLGFETMKNLILCSDKSLVKGDYLIDDCSGDGQPEFEGKWIQFGSEQFPNWDVVLKYILKNEGIS